MKIKLNEPQPRGGTIKRRKGSSILYVDMYYFGVRITRSTGLRDTPQNRAKVRRFLDKSKEQIEQQTFRFAEAFPGASAREKRFFTELEGREFHPEPQCPVRSLCPGVDEADDPGHAVADQTPGLHLGPGGEDSPPLRQALLLCDHLPEGAGVHRDPLEGERGENLPSNLRN